jgi:hypothetical protein
MRATGVPLRQVHARSFVSHSASARRSKLGEIDLLPRIRHKLFDPELAPLFGLRNEDLLESRS